MTTIGVLIHDFQLGGAERVAIRLANEWHRLRCTVILFSGGPAGLQRRLVDEGIEVVVASPPIQRGLRGSPVALGRWLAQEVAARGVEVLYLPGNSYFRAVRRLAPTGARVYVTVTNSLWRVDRTWLRNVVFSCLTRARLRRARGVVSMSPSLLRQERKIHGHVAASAALPNALFAGLPEATGIHRRDWHLCAVGRLVAQKNFTLLLHSFALLADLPVTLSIAGDGPQLAQLQQLAGTLGIAERVTFLGAVADAARCMAEAEVLVLTSDYEGYPAVAVEAIAVGTFVVASRCSVAIADILQTPAAGEIVPVQRAGDYAAAIRRFFNSNSRRLAAQRQQAALPLVRLHESAQAAREYLRFMGVHAGMPDVQAEQLRGNHATGSRRHQ